VSNQFHIVIPARMASQRLPGKPLLEIAGTPLIEHVYRRACASSARSVVIATDSEEIAQAAKGFGARAVLTSKDHRSGSDRIAECADVLGWTDETLLVNLQGDEPLMPAVCLDQAAALLAGDETASASSLYWPITDAAEAADSNAVKVVTDRHGAALYFSRSVVPHPRGFADLESAIGAGIAWKRHIGLYAYRAGALRQFARLKPTPLESAEKLEQLRFLEYGLRIVMAEAAAPIPAGVDTPEDLRRVGALMAEQG
jgi:3-deoxy-manno-octulosonate cytidylyltransferase (CMP-KDO synthetase)